jgi:hypothetical protein
MGAQRRRAIRVMRVLKSALDAYATSDEHCLQQLEAVALRVLKKHEDQHREDPSGTVDVRRFAPKDRPGWVLVLGDPVRKKGRTRSTDVAALVSTLEWQAKNKSGPFAAAATGEAFARWLLRFAFVAEWAREMIPNADEVLTLQDVGTLPPKHPARIARGKLASAFDAWKDDGGTDHEKLLRAGFRAVGVPKADAANLFKAADMREKRRGTRRRMPTAAE